MKKLIKSLVVAVMLSGCFYPISSPYQNCRNTATAKMTLGVTDLYCSVGEDCAALMVISAFSFLMSGVLVLTNNAIHAADSAVNCR